MPPLGSTSVDILMIFSGIILRIILDCTFVASTEREPIYNGNTGAEPPVGSRAEPMVRGPP